MSMWYVLEGRTAVPLPDDMIGWAKDGRPTWARVAADEVGDVRVSTVFLGLDHALDGGPPHIFETMVFGGTLDGEQERYSTWEQAEAGHARWVKRVTDA